MQSRFQRSRKLVWGSSINYIIGASPVTVTKFNSRYHKRDQEHCLLSEERNAALKNSKQILVFFSKSGFTVRLMKLELQGPLLARAPSRALGEALVISYKCSEILLAHIRKILHSGFPKFETSHKHLHGITNREL